MRVASERWKLCWKEIKWSSHMVWKVYIAFQRRHRQGKSFRKVQRTRWRSLEDTLHSATSTQRTRWHSLKGTLHSAASTQLKCIYILGPCMDLNFEPNPAQKYYQKPRPSPAQTVNHYFSRPKPIFHFCQLRPQPRPDCIRPKPSPAHRILGFYGQNPALAQAQ